MNPGTLYMVATPIGNLGDMTYRAVQILEDVDVIACEDTRVTGKLCAHYEIDTARTTIHQHSTLQKITSLVQQISDGKNIAYVSDAGTPGISDPGNQLVREARDQGIIVIAVPGATAISALISIAGCDMQKFTFLAYPPHKKGRKTFFENASAIVRDQGQPVIYYDSVHRFHKNLLFLAEMYPEVHVVVGRELTKMFEEVQAGPIEDVCEYYIQNPSKLKGEFVIIIHV